MKVKISTEWHFNLINFNSRMVLPWKRRWRLEEGPVIGQSTHFVARAFKWDSLSYINILKQRNGSLLPKKGGQCVSGCWSPAHNISVRWRGEGRRMSVFRRPAGWAIILYPFLILEISCNKLLRMHLANERIAGAACPNSSAEDEQLLASQ